MLLRTRRHQAYCSSHQTYCPWGIGAAKALVLTNHSKAFQDYWYAYILLYEGSFSTQPLDLDELNRRVFFGYCRDMTAEKMVFGRMTRQETGKVFWVGDKWLIEQWEDT